MHTRTIEMSGYARDDGLFDIEGRIADVRATKYITEAGRVVNPGEPLHDMRIRMIIDTDMNVRNIEAVTDASPYPHCPEAASFLHRLEGANLMHGWRDTIRDKLPRHDSCTHIKELLQTMASSAFQSLILLEKAKWINEPSNVRPKKLDSCYAHSITGPLVKKKWPQFFINRR